MTDTTAAALPAVTDARWDALKAYLETERVSNAAEAREWQADGSMAERYASRSFMAGKALAKMTELEAGR